MSLRPRQRQQQRDPCQRGGHLRSRCQDLLLKLRNPPSLVGSRIVAGSGKPFVGGIVGSQHHENFRPCNEKTAEIAAAGGADELGVDLQCLFELFLLEQPLRLLLKCVQVHGGRDGTHGFTGRQEQQPRH